MKAHTVSSVGGTGDKPLLFISKPQPAGLHRRDYLLRLSLLRQKAAKKSLHRFFAIFVLSISP
jgi:hypothetical protein